MSEPQGELRFDPLTRDWVNVVGHRQQRPNLPDAGCPFCVGGLEAPEPYTVRWFPNRWPALGPGAAIDLDEAVHDEITRVPAVGASEVVLFSPDHDQSLASLPLPQVRAVVDLWAERTEQLLARPEIQYVLVFENRGREVGATIDHPHGQIYGYPFVPPVPAREQAVARRHGCAVCAEVRRETAEGTRVVTRAGDWVAWVPFAAGHAYGMRLASRTHMGSLRDLPNSSRDDLAALLVDALSRYDRLWPSEATSPFPYLMWFHQASAGNEDEWHVHAHVAPPWRAPGLQRYLASAETGSGTLSNPVAPEVAAQALRDA